MQSAFLVQTWFQLVAESLGTIEKISIVTLLEDHEVEKVFQFRDFEGLKSCLLPTVLDEHIHVLEAAEDLSYEQLATRLKHAISLDQELREVCTHEAEAEDAHVDTL